MAGQVWLAVERFVSAATEEDNDNAWKLLFTNGKVPSVLFGGTIEPSWERPALIYRALDATLVKARKSPDNASESAPEDEPTVGGADEPLTDKIFSSDESDSSRAPRMPDTNPRLVMPEYRLTLMKFVLVSPLALSVSLAENRYSVTEVWSKPETRKDTVTSVMDRLCGVNTQLLGAGKGENNTNAPPDTPMHNTEERLRADPTVARLGKVSFEQFQEALRMLGPSSLIGKLEGDAAEIAAEHSRQFVSGEVFQEAKNKKTSRQERTREAVAFTNKLNSMAKSYQKQLAVMNERLFWDELVTPLDKGEQVARGILQGYWRTIQLSTSKSRIASRQIMSVFADTFESLDRRILSELMIHSPIRLAKLDPIEPLIHRRKLKEVTVKKLSLDLQRRRMESEQKAAFDSLVAIKELIEVSLNAYDRRIMDEVIRPTFIEIIQPLRKELVSADDRLRQSSITPWKEAHTRTSFPSFSDHVSSFLSPTLVRLRTALYRSILDEHLGRVYGLSRELRNEKSSKLKPPDETLFTRGIRLYRAFISLRDAMLPTLDTHKDMASLVGTVDLLFSAHLDAACDDASVRESWNSAWKGRLSTEQVEVLLNGDQRPSTTWFRAPGDVHTRPGDVATANLLGLDSRAFVLLEEPSGGFVIGKRYAEPATMWHYWLQALAAGTRPPGAQQLVPASSATTTAPPLRDLGEDPSSAMETDDGNDDNMDLGRGAASTLPVYIVSGEEEERTEKSSDDTIELRSVASDEQVIVPDDAVNFINSWETRDRTKPDSAYNTPLWYLLRVEVVRAYVKRFHPLVKKRGPLVKAFKTMDKIEEQLKDIDDVLHSNIMHDVGDPERKLKLSEEAKIELARTKAKLAGLIGAVEKDK